MNSISNIEIINFEEYNHEEKSMDLDKDLNINYMNNFLIEKYDSEYSEGNEMNVYDSSCNMSICSEINSNFSNVNMSMNDSCNNSNFGDLTACSENLKSSSNLTDSFSRLEKVTNISFSFLRRTNKFKLNLESDSNISSLSFNSTASKYFPCSFEGCEKVYKSKENLTLHYKNIHLKEKPYSCKFCNSQFSHRNGKTYHERKFHTKYLPHKCINEDCTLSFASKSALSYHLKSQHGKNSNKKQNRIHRSKFNEKIMEMVGYNTVCN